MLVHPLGRKLIEARHISKQRRAGRVQIDADIVHARFDHGIERFAQVFGFHVVLIKADADIRRLDLHQFRQRIEQPAAD
jgi:hypothetical protein